MADAEDESFFSSPSTTVVFLRFRCWNPSQDDSLFSTENNCRQSSKKNNVVPTLAVEHPLGRTAEYPLGRTVEHPLGSQNLFYGTLGDRTQICQKPFVL